MCNKFSVFDSCDVIFYATLGIRSCIKSVMLQFNLYTWQNWRWELSLTVLWKHWILAYFVNVNSSCVRFEVSDCVLLLWQVNELDRVPVTVHVYNYSKTTMPNLPPVWSKSPEAKFNIFAAVSEAAHRMRGLEYKCHRSDADSTATVATRDASNWCSQFVLVEHDVWNLKTS